MIDKKLSPILHTKYDPIDNFLGTWSNKILTISTISYKNHYIWHMIDQTNRSVYHSLTYKNLDDKISILEPINGSYHWCLDQLR